MNNEGITSLAVVDNQYNVVGNISNVDVKASTICDPQQTRISLANETGSYSRNHPQHLCSKILAFILSR